jgi:hypothetical protein
MSGRHPIRPIFELRRRRRPEVCVRPSREETVARYSLSIAARSLGAGGPPRDRLSRTIRWMQPHPPLPDAARMNDEQKPTRYEVHLRGVLSDAMVDAFPELRARRSDHETVLVGALPDQAALHGVIGRIEALGLELLEVRRVGSRDAEPADADQDRPTG